MLEKLFRKPSTGRLYEESRFCPELEDFSGWLQVKGYTHRCARGHLHRLKQALERIEGAAPGAVFVPQQLQQAFAFASGRKPELALGTQRAYQCYLREHGRLRPEPVTERFGSLYRDYGHDLVDVRGFALSTVSQHLSTAATFLANSLGSDRPLASLGAQDVERYIAIKSAEVTRQSLQHLVAHLRSLLRYLYRHGEIPLPLEAIDAPRTYRDELPPRALDWRVVQKLLRSIDRSRDEGRRDHAILHLMAHYGLRPSEVATLTLGAIDWETATLHVRQRKTLSDLDLPIAGQTLRLLRDYLGCRRRNAGNQPLFLRVRCPIRGITHYTVGDLYLKRARQSKLPLEGTSCYVLRHSFAMRLLRRGVGIKAIGDLLGHRALESTCVYLRLDVDMLRAVALPVPTAPTRTGGA